MLKLLLVLVLVFACAAMSGCVNPRVEGINREIRANQQLIAELEAIRSDVERDAMNAETQLDYMKHRDLRIQLDSDIAAAEARIRALYAERDAIANARQRAIIGGLEGMKSKPSTHCVTTRPYPGSDELETVCTER